MNKYTGLFHLHTSDFSFDGQTTLENATELIKKNTRRLAKSQRTWFKTFTNVNWLDIEPEETAEKIFEHTKILLKNSE